MLELVSQNYWWPGLSRYVAKFITGCDACNQTKTFPTQKVGKLIPNKIPDQCWQVISVNMVGELLDSKGYNAILVVVDRLSKRIHTVPTVTSLDSAGIARCRRGDVQCCALSTQTTQDSPGAEPRRSKRKLRQIFGIKLNRQLILFQTHRLVAGTQTGHRHPSFRTKHDKTRSLSPRRLIPPDIGTHR